MKAILPLSNKVRKAINDEVNRQTGENVRKLSVNIQALVLWALHQQFGFGKKRLLQFQEAFLPVPVSLSNKY